jgi:uncharacterized protein YggE
MDVKNNPSPERNKLSFALDLRIVVVLLVVVIIAMLALWRPWSASGVDAHTRTVNVRGEASLSAEPDEFVFYPTYEFTDSDKQTALNKLSNKTDEIVNKLKGLGVPSSKIKTNSNDYSAKFYRPIDEPDSGNSYTLQLTITTSSKELAQKVQDYLATTAPSGTVSPQASFSDTRRKQLENQARTKATQDARNKADQMARDLGFSVKAVKSVADNSGFGGVIPLAEGRATMSAPASDTKQLTVQPGENELTYTVEVTYYIK